MASQYTAQFKTIVAKETLEAKTYAEVSRKYNIPVRHLKEWSSQYKLYGDLAFEAGGPEKFKDKQLMELQREIAELREENEILKKAAAFFSKKSL